MRISFARMLTDVFLLVASFAAVCSVVALKIYIGNDGEFGFPIRDLILPLVDVVGTFLLFFGGVLLDGN